MPLPGGHWMDRKKTTVWVAVGAFLATVWIASAMQLVQSYRLFVETAYTRSDLPGYLVSEWIGESFHNVELLLRESLAGFDASNLSFESRTDEENRTINQALVRRAAMHGHIVFLGIFDHDCVIQFGSVASIIGDSSADLERDYCEEVRKTPVERLKLSGFFVSSTGDMNVSATYPLLSDAGEVIGFALAGLDLSFFQRWLDEFDDSTVTITIMDERRVLLARKPENADIGRPIDDARLEAFVLSDQIQGSFRRRSPIDNVDRIWTLRRTRELPFVIATGYAVEDVLKPWYSQLAAHAVAILLLSAISIALARSYQQNQKNALHMEMLAMNDQLTGLMNRRSFDTLARARLEQDRKRDIGTVFIMVDVDHFKNINDRHGHETGDAVLKEVSSAIRGNFRSTDLVCRWGGEEYLIYLPGADLRIALQLAERLRAQVEQTDFVHGATVTISAGIALLTKDDTLEDVIRRADEKLYQAKGSGRNRVCY
jgi:diguanylate cyclase (GGDEF)-like protein